ncbi:MAG: cryptochrome/photolyase family protein [Cyanobacteriota bacterium]
MKTGLWILGDQLNIQQTALATYSGVKARTPVIFIESWDYARSRPYHRQKLVLVWAAMRHFAEDLKADGWPITYASAENFRRPLLAWLERESIDNLVLTKPNDRPFQDLIEALDLPCALTWLENNHFLWSREAFQVWAQNRRRLLLEDFYRAGRRRFQVLMVGDQPLGGRWNFDPENRRPPKKGLTPPPVLSFAPDAMTRETLKQVKDLDLPGYGDPEPFNWGVTRAEALTAFQHFLNHGLPRFGAYQDAMITGENFLWHSLLSPYLNLGLLTPMEVITGTEKAYQENPEELPLNSVEGFIRQILGWREYLFGLYHFLGADYSQKNWFNHDLPLPNFYWDGAQTKMNCLRQVLQQVERTGYAHHIQRLMILSNFALISGVSPQALESWFHAAFIDGYDWVMQTNVLGMGQFADGGLLASKPYASSGNYIQKMSDYCQRCAYNPKIRLGESACPFNYFYWDFLARHRETLAGLGRMGLALKNLDRLDLQELAQMRRQAEDWRRRRQKEDAE